MDAGFLFVVGAVGLAAASAITRAVASRFDPRQRARRELSRAAPKHLGELREGDRARVFGVARRGATELTSPVTGRRCLGYWFLIQEIDDESIWKTLVQQQECAPFELVADGMVARVEGPFLVGLEIDHRSDEIGAENWLVRRTLAQYGESPTNMQGGPRSVRIEEGILEEGDPIFVLGQVSLSVDQRGQRETARGQPMLRVISGSEQRPTVIADEHRPGDLTLAG
jgi:hypothetical protein